jgi:hypothetical protein
MGSTLKSNGNETRVFQNYFSRDFSYLFPNLSSIPARLRLGLPMPCKKMPYQFHAVMQQTQNIQNILARNTKHHKMAIFATVLGDVHLLSQSNMPRPAYAPAIALAAIDFR